MSSTISWYCIKTYAFNNSYKLNAFSGRYIIKYLSSDNNIAYITDSTMTCINVGTVTITAYNDQVSPVAVLTKTFTVYDPGNPPTDPLLQSFSQGSSLNIPNSYYHTFYTVSNQNPTQLNYNVYDNYGNLFNTSFINLKVNVIDLLKVLDVSNDNPYTIGIFDKKTTMDLAYTDIYNSELSSIQISQLIANVNSTYNEPRTAAIIYIVTVSGGVFWLKAPGSYAVERPINFLTNTNKNLYLFNQSDASNRDNTFSVGMAIDSSVDYTLGVVTSGTPGYFNSYTLIDFAFNDFPLGLCYYNSDISGMGNCFYQTPLLATIDSQTVYNTGSPITKTVITGINAMYTGSPSITQTDAGVYTTTITGTGNSYGTFTATLTIQKIPLIATVNSQTVYNTGSSITKLLFSDIVGTFSGSRYITQTVAGVYTTTITATGLYTGSYTGTLTILKIQLIATVNSQTVYNTGSPITKTLISDIVGTYSGSPSITQTVAGVYTTTITASGLYTGSYTATLTILKIPFTATVTSQTLPYTGSSISATLITNINGTYSGSPSITQTFSGTYTTTITGTGLYTGSYTATLVILNNVQIPLSGGTVPLSNASNLSFTQNIYNYLQGKTLHMKFNLNGLDQDINLIKAEVDNDVFQIRIVRNSGYITLTITYGGNRSTNSFTPNGGPQYGFFPIRTPGGEYAVIMDNFNYSSNYHLFFYFTNQNTNDGQYYPRIYVYNSNGTLITNTWINLSNFSSNNSDPAYNLNLYGQSGYNVTYTKTDNSSITFSTVWVSIDSYGKYWSFYTFTGLKDFPYQLLNGSRGPQNQVYESQYTLSILEYYTSILTPALMSSYST